MKILTVPLFLLFSSVQGQTITGKWKTIDDSSGEQKSIVEIYQKEGKIFGKISRIFTAPSDDPDPLCTKCPEDDPRFNKKVIGMDIIRNLERSGNEYTNGTILDPESGKIYRCKLWMDNNDLKVRGYWGPFYRTQTWKRVN